MIFKRSIPNLPPRSDMRYPVIAMNKCGEQNSKPYYYDLLLI